MRTRLPVIKWILLTEMLFRTERPPLMILCNPHNPTGRCWSVQELEQLLTLCETYDVTLLSDEIWADLLLPREQFTSVLHLGERWHSRVISATSASKTFGLSTLRIANFLIPAPALREHFYAVWMHMGWMYSMRYPSKRVRQHGNMVHHG